MLERMGDQAKAYVVCSYAGRKVEGFIQPRKALLELSANTVPTSRLDVRKRPNQSPRGLCGCRLCEIAMTILGVGKSIWKRSHEHQILVWGSSEHM